MSDFYMCSNCDTQHQTAEEAMECCMCESCAAKDKCIKELTEENELLAKRIDDQKEGLAKYEAQLDALQQQVCDECDPDDYGWKYNAVEGRHPCTCIVESGAYQELKQQLDKVQHESIGWMYAYACILMDEGKDIRKIEVPTILQDFKEQNDA